MDSVSIFMNLSSEDEEDRQNKQNLIQIRRRIRSNCNPFDLPDVKFRTYFRVNKEAFAFLLNEVHQHHPVIKHACSVPVVLKLAATLRFCAEGGYQTGVGNDFKLGLAQPTVSKIISQMIDLMEDTICSNWIQFRTGDQEKDMIKMDFFEKHGIPGVIGCVDGTHIKIHAPTKSEQHRYFNRKGFYSMNAMVVSTSTRCGDYVITTAPNEIQLNCPIKATQSTADTKPRHLTEPN